MKKKADFLPSNIYEIVYKVNNSDIGDLALQNFFILIAILFLLPIVFDIILTIMEQCTSADASYIDVQQGGSILHKVHNIESNLYDSFRGLEDISWGLDLYWMDWDDYGGGFLCGVFSALLGVCIWKTSKAGILSSIFMAVVSFFLYKLILLIYKGTHHIISMFFLLPFKLISIRIKRLRCNYRNCLILQEKERIEKEEKAERERREKAKREKEKKEAEEKQLWEGSYQNSKLVSLSEYRPLTDEDWDDIDDILRALHKEYGEDWGKDL